MPNHSGLFTDGLLQSPFQYATGRTDCLIGAADGTVAKRWAAGGTAVRTGTYKFKGQASGVEAGIRGSGDVLLVTLRFTAHVNLSELHRRVAGGCHHTTAVKNG
jgi:hypothetical protein